MDDAPAADAVADVVAALQATGGGLLGALGGEANRALSPLSLLTGLAMTATGARGESLEQLESLFGGLTVDEVNRGLAGLRRHLAGLVGPVERTDGVRGEVALARADALFAQHDVGWETSFVHTLAHHHDAGLRPVDWTDPDAARDTVNAWTAEQTRGHVRDLLPPGAVDASTALVLVDALYLTAPWRHPFAGGLTTPRPFTLTDGTTVDVPTMTTEDPVRVPTGEGDGWRSARLPCAGDGLAMTVVLPDPGRLADVEASVARGGLGRLLEVGPTDLLDVRLPSFTFRAASSMQGALEARGVVAPFDPAFADFAPMTTDVPLHVGAVMHEVVVAVDEAGVEAAAASAVLMCFLSAAPPSTPFWVDRPFVFVVHDVEHGTPLVLGRVAEPRAPLPRGTRRPGRRVRRAWRSRSTP